uniref:Uncharacterized protein n=1 Tax=Bracon brevicornis TaxID=1563983 RepID=A0A6V7J1W3_9HYME
MIGHFFLPENAVTREQRTVTGYRSPLNSLPPVGGKKIPIVKNMSSEILLWHQVVAINGSVQGFFGNDIENAEWTTTYYVEWFW